MDLQTMTFSYDSMIQRGDPANGQFRRCGLSVPHIHVDGLYPYPSTYYCISGVAIQFIKSQSDRTWCTWDEIDKVSEFLLHSRQNWCTWEDMHQVKHMDKKRSEVVYISSAEIQQRYGVGGVAVRAEDYRIYPDIAFEFSPPPSPRVVEKKVPRKKKRTSKATGQDEMAGLFE